MSSATKALIDASQLAAVLEHVPAGITVIDEEGRMLYYNTYCAQFVDRKPEYIGRDIRLCHQQPKSIQKIEKMLSDLKKGIAKEFCYEAKRSGNKLGVRIAPFDIGGKRGLIQRFAVLF